MISAGSFIAAYNKALCAVQMLRVTSGSGAEASDPDLSHVFRDLARELFSNQLASVMIWMKHTSRGWNMFAVTRMRSKNGS